MPSLRLPGCFRVTLPKGTFEQWNAESGAMPFNLRKQRASGCGKFRVGIPASITASRPRSSGGSKAKADASSPRPVVHELLLMLVSLSEWTLAKSLIRLEWLELPFASPGWPVFRHRRLYDKTVALFLRTARLPDNRRVSELPEEPGSSKERKYCRVGSRMLHQTLKAMLQCQFVHAVGVLPPASVVALLQFT